MKISVGTVARKKLNATDDALVVIAPFTIPLKKYRITETTGTPFSPGVVIRWNRR